MAKQSNQVYLSSVTLRCVMWDLMQAVINGTLTAERAEAFQQELTDVDMLDTAAVMWLADDIRERLNTMFLADVDAVINA